MCFIKPLNTNKMNEINVKQLGKDDVVVAQNLFLLLQEIFDVENVKITSASYTEKLLENSNIIVFAAEHQEEIIEGLTAYVLPMYHSESAEIYIYDIAVKPKFQRIGVGKKLLATLSEYCRQNEIKEMFVQANEEDEHALDFYRSMHYKEAKVAHFTYNIL